MPPSLEHNALVDLFRNNPAVVPQLLKRLLRIKIPAYASIDVVEASLDQLIPIEFRADLVIELKDADGNLLLAIVLEVQLSQDPRKKYSWPVYATVLRSRRRCQVCVLVIAPEPDVAAWAAEPIELGPGGSVVIPLVIGPAELPRVVDPAQAQREPELAVMSARAHGNAPGGLEIVMAALSGMIGFDPVAAGVYLQVIYSALRLPMRKALENLMDQQRLEGVTLPPFAQKLVNMGKVEGKAEGKAENTRLHLFKLLARTGISLDDAQRARIEACQDPTELEQLFDRALTAKTAEELLG